MDIISFPNLSSLPDYEKFSQFRRGQNSSQGLPAFALKCIFALKFYSRQGFLNGATAFNKMTLRITVKGGIKHNVSLFLSHLERQYAECHFIECHFIECHFMECHFIECHFIECHFIECHFIDCHYAECHFIECHYAECHFIDWHYAVSFY